MESWLKISLLLCMFGFFKELRPSEPFVSPYLLSEFKNYTNAQVSQDIYPVGTYSYLALLVVVFLVTDICRYKSVIVFDALCGIVAWCLLVWSQGIIAAQILEFFYGAFLAGEVAYYSYAYARIENRELYARLTSHTRSACLFGRCASGILGQSLFSTETADLQQLHMISLGCISVATVFALCLPRVEHSIYFHQKKIERRVSCPIKDVQSIKDNGAINCVSGGISAAEIEDKFTIPKISLTPPDCLSSIDYASSEPSTHDTVSTADAACPMPGDGSIPDDGESDTAVTKAFRLLWKHAHSSYTDLWVIRWSAWWTISTAGFLQVLSYVQMLWDEIAKDQEAAGKEVYLYNGAMEAISTVLGALATLGCGWLRLNWEFLGEFTLAGIAVIEGLVMIWSATTKQLWAAYLCYIIFGIFYQAMVTVASMEVAKKIEEDCYGLIFGINTFVALLIQTIWTIVVVTDAGFALGYRDQFLVCGGYFLSLGLLFLVIALISTCKMGLRVFLKQSLWLPKPEVNNQAA